MSEEVISESATIRRSQQDVWDYITTTENWQAWYAGGLSGVSPAWEEGATMTFASGEKPVISHYAPPELLQWGTGATIRLEATDAATTRITYGHTIGSAFTQDPALLAVYEDIFYDEAGPMLQKLKHLLESQEPERSPEIPEPIPAASAGAASAGAASAGAAPAAATPTAVDSGAAHLVTEPVEDGLMEDHPLATAPVDAALADDSPMEDHPLATAPVDTEPAAAAPLVTAAPAPPAPEPAQDAGLDPRSAASRILNSSVIVYREASETSPRVAECFTGDRVQFGAAIENEGTTWVEVTLAGGRQGYLLGSTRHFPADRAFACLPVTGGTVAATFPNTCVYCAQPAESELEVVYDESPKGGTRLPGALLVKLQVLYCIRHARESRRNRQAVAASVVVAGLLAALVAITLGTSIVQTGIFGFDSDELVLLAAIIGFCGAAYLTFRLVMLLAKKLLPRLFKSMAHMGTGQLGIWLARAPQDNVLVLQFVNDEFARQFRELNPYEYRSLTPEYPPSPVRVQMIPAAPPKRKTAAPVPAGRVRPKRALLIVGGLVALLATIACLVALVSMSSVLTAPGKSANVEMAPAQENREQEGTLAPSPTPEPATLVAVALEPTASPVSVALEASATSEPAASPVPTGTPAPTFTASPTRTPRPANTAAPGGASLASPATFAADSPVLGIAFSPDGEILASAEESGALQLWDLATGQVLHTLSGHSDGALSVAFSPDGQTLASGGNDDLIKLWAASTGALLQTLEGHDLWVNSVAYSPDGKIIASGSADRTVKLWDAATGQLLHTLEGHTDWIRSVAFSPNGDLLASGSCAMVDSEKSTTCLIGEIILWDTSTGEGSRAFNNQTGWVYSLGFSPDGQLLASGAGDESITLWSVAERQPMTTLKGHRGRVNSLSFSPDGTMLVSGSDDDSIRLWAVATGKLAKILKGHGKWVNSVAFTPDGQAIGSGSSDATVRLWNASTEQ